MDPHPTGEAEVQVEERDLADQQGTPFPPVSTGCSKARSVATPSPVSVSRRRCYPPQLKSPDRVNLDGPGVLGDPGAADATQDAGIDDEAAEGLDGQHVK